MAIYAYSAMRRSGRTDIKIPILMPDEVARLTAGAKGKGPAPGTAR